MRTLDEELVWNDPLTHALVTHDHKFLKQRRRRPDVNNEDFYAEY